MHYAMFLLTRKNVANYKFKDPKLPEIMELLLCIYALKEIKKDPQLLYEEGFFGKNSGTLLVKCYNEKLLELRPHIIGLVELTAMHKEDGSIFSTIGNKYGDIYES